MPWMATTAPGRSVGVAQRVERGDSRAQQRRGLDRVHHLGNPHQSAGAGVHDLGVAAVLGGSRLRLVEAVDEIATPALRRTHRSGRRGSQGRPGRRPAKR